MSTVLLFTALMLSGCLDVLLFAVMLGWEKEWFVAIVLLFTTLLLSGCLGVALCCSDAAVRKRR